MKYLTGADLIGNFTRFGRIVYARTSFHCFNYGKNTANKIIWRFYWLTPTLRSE